MKTAFVGEKIGNKKEESCRKKLKHKKAQIFNSEIYIHLQKQKQKIALFLMNCCNNQ